jgi:fatty-acyl-CoA synthase
VDDPHAVGRWVADRARLHPGKVAIVFGGREVTYGELDDTSSRLARLLLARGLAPGDRVGSLAENRPEQVVLLFACAKAGLIFFPMNWRLANVELAAQMELMTPATWFVSSAQLSRVDDTLIAIGGAPLDLEVTCQDLEMLREVDLPPVGADDGLAIIATSGTTGRPKGVLLTHANFFWTNLSLDLVAPITHDDVVLQVLPQFHIGGWNVQPMLAWWKGATVVLEAAFDPGRVLELVARRRVTTMAGVPTNYQMIGQHPGFDGADLSSLRSAVVGGAAMPYTLVEQWHGRGVALFQGYGLTESAPNVFCLDDADALSHPCSVGRPYPYVEVALLDCERGGVIDGPAQGELLVRGPSLFAGYWRDPAATAAVMDDGWLRTGDVAARDADGYYRIVGRAKEMFVTGGENVYPVEVESVITSFDTVVSAAVVSVEDPTWGESGVAFVECARGETVDLDALAAHCRSRLARYKVPVRFEIVAELPRNPVGKIDKAALRARAREDAARPA